MGSWYACNLGDAMLGGYLLDEIKSSFLSEFESKNRPDDMAVFFRHESEGRLQCEIKVYFPPTTAHLAGEFDATPCNKPSSHDLGLLAGSKKAKDIFW